MENKVLSYHYHLTSKVFYPKYKTDSKMIALALPDPFLARNTSLKKQKEKLCQIKKLFVWNLQKI